MRRVVVTGLGLVSPLASGVEPTWKRLVDGQSGVRGIQSIDVSDLPNKVAGEVPVGDAANDHFNADDFVPPKDQRKMDRFIIFALAAGVQAVNDAGCFAFVVTNQSGVARGFFSAAFVDEVHRELTARLSAGGARIDAYYYCPHHPDGSVAEYGRICDCRKPARGLIDRAARDLNLDPARSFIVGDK